MELNTREKYVESTDNELPETKKVKLNQSPPKDDNDSGYLRFPKLGPNNDPTEEDITDKDLMS